MKMEKIFFAFLDKLAHSKQFFKRDFFYWKASLKDLSIEGGQWTVDTSTESNRERNFMSQIQETEI